MNDTKMLQILVDGQKSIRHCLKQVREEIKKIDQRLTKIEQQISIA